MSLPSVEGTNPASGTIPTRNRNPSVYPDGVPAINAEKTYDDFDDLVFTLDAVELDDE